MEEIIKFSLMLLNEESATRKFLKGKQQKMGEKVLNFRLTVF